MIIGILSDSHGRAAITARAASMLVNRGAQLLVHLGDIGDPSVIDALLCELGPDGRPNPPVRIVFGNCDHNVPMLTRYAEALGVIVQDPVGTIDAAGKRIVFTHGHLREPMQNAIRLRADYLLHGHTHERHDERRGHTRIINPGALFRASVHTAALLDVAGDLLQVLDVDTDTPL